MRSIDLDVGYWTHRKTIALMRLVGPLGAAVPPRLWCWAVTGAPSGVLTGMAAEDVAAVVGWPARQASQLVNALVQVGFLDRGEDDSLSIHGWMEHTGAALAYCDREAQRKRAARRARWVGEIPRDDSEHPAPRAQDVRRTSAGHREPPVRSGPVRSGPDPDPDPEPEEEPDAASTRRGPADAAPAVPDAPPRPKKPRRRRNGTAAEKPAEPPSRVQQFIAAFCDEYRAATGGPYSLTGKDRGQAKAFADGIAPEHWERRHEIARAYLAAEREWWADKGRPLCGLVASWARYAEQVMRAAAAEQQRALNPDGAPF